MKIIKKVDTSNWTYAFRCVSCESQLEACPGDVKYQYYSGDYRDPSYEVFSVNCIVCNQGKNISPNDIPKALQVEIRQRKGSK